MPARRRPNRAPAAAPAHPPGGGGGRIPPPAGFRCTPPFLLNGIMTTPPANDPVHDPAAPAAGLPETRAEAPAAPPAPAAPEAPPAQPAKKKKVKSTTAGGTWTALIIGAILLIVLLAFIMQNGESVTLHLFAWDLNFPLGVGMLLAAILGALIMACVGGIRMLQLRRQIKKG